MSVEKRLTAIEERLTGIEARLDAIESGDKRPMLTFTSAPDLLTTAQAADLLNVGERFIFKKLKDGELKSVKDGRRYTRILKASILAYIAAHS